MFLNESFDGFTLEDNMNATFMGYLILTKPTKYNFSMDVKSLHPHALNWTNQYENLTSNFNLNVAVLNLNEFMGEVLLKISCNKQNEAEFNDLSF